MAAQLREWAAATDGHAEDAGSLLAQQDSVGVLGDRVREMLGSHRSGAVRLRDEALVLADQADGAANEAEKTLCVMFAFGIQLVGQIAKALVAASAAGPAGQVAAAPVVESMLVKGRVEVEVMRAGLKQAFARGAADTVVKLTGMGPLRLVGVVGRSAVVPVVVDGGVQGLQVVEGNRELSVVGVGGENPRGIDVRSVVAGGVAGAGGAVGGVVAGRLVPRLLPRVQTSRVLMGLVQGTAGAVSGLGAAAMITGWPEHFDQVLAELLNGGFGGMAAAHAGPHARPDAVAAPEIDGGGPFIRPDQARGGGVETTAADPVARERAGSPVDSDASVPMAADVPLNSVDHASADILHPGAAVTAPQAARSQLISDTPRLVEQEIRGVPADTRSAGAAVSPKADTPATRLAAELAERVTVDDQRVLEARRELDRALAGLAASRSESESGFGGRDVEAARAAYDAAVSEAVEERVEARRVEEEAAIAAADAERRRVESETGERMRAGRDAVAAARTEWVAGRDACEAAVAVYETSVRGHVGESIRSVQEKVDAAGAALRRHEQEYRRYRGGSEPEVAHVARLERDIERAKTQVRAAMVEREALLRTLPGDHGARLKAAETERNEVVSRWGRRTFRSEVVARERYWRQALAEHEEVAKAKLETAEGELRRRTEAYRTARRDFLADGVRAIDERFRVASEAGKADIAAYEAGVADRGEAFRAASDKRLRAMKDTDALATDYYEEMVSAGDPSDPVAVPVSPHALLDRIVAGTRAERYLAMRKWAELTTGKDMRVTQRIAWGLELANMKTGEGKTLLTTVKTIDDALQHGVAYVWTSSDSLVLETIGAVEQVTRSEHGALPVDTYRLADMTGDGDFPEPTPGRGRMFVGTPENAEFLVLRRGKAFLDRLRAAGASDEEVTALRAELFPRHKQGRPPLDEIKAALDGAAERHGLGARFEPLPGGRGDKVHTLDEMDTVVDGREAVLSPGAGRDEDPEVVARLEEVWQRFKAAQRLPDGLTARDFGRPEGTRGFWQATLTPEAIAKLDRVPGEPLTAADAEMYTSAALAEWARVRNSDYIEGRGDSPDGPGKVLLLASDTNDQLQANREEGTETRTQGLVGQFMDLKEGLPVKANLPEEAMYISVDQLIGSSYLGRPTGYSGTLKIVEAELYERYGIAGVPENPPYYASQLERHYSLNFDTRHGKLAAMARDVVGELRLAPIIDNGVIVGVQQHGRPQLSEHMDNRNIRGDDVRDDAGNRLRLTGWHDKLDHEKGLVDWVDQLAHEHVHAVARAHPMLDAFERAGAPADEVAALRQRIAQAPPADVVRAMLDRAAAHYGLDVRFDSVHALTVADGVGLRYLVLDAHTADEHGTGEAAKRWANDQIKNEWGAPGTLAFVNKEFLRGTDWEPTPESIDLGGTLARMDGGPSRGERAFEQGVGRASRGGTTTDRENGGTPGTFTQYLSPEDYHGTAENHHVTEQVVMFTDAVAARREAATAHAAEDTSDSRAELDRADHAVEQAEHVLRTQTAPAQLRAVEQHLLSSGRAHLPNTPAPITSATSASEPIHTPVAAPEHHNGADADTSRPEHPAQRYARLAQWLGIPAAVAAALGDQDDEHDEDSLNRLQTGLPAAVVEALNQQLDHPAPATVVHDTSLSDEQALDQLTHRRQRLTAELELTDDQVAGAEGIRRVGDEVDEARDELANALGIQPEAVDAATAREVVTGAAVRLLEPVTATESLAPPVIAAASRYLALTHLLDLVMGIHQRNPNGCVNNAVTMMRVLHPKRQDAYHMPDDTPLAGHDAAKIEWASGGGSFRGFHDLDKAAESLAARPGGISWVVHRWMDQPELPEQGSEGTIRSHLVLLHNRSDRIDEPKLVVLDINAGTKRRVITPADLASRSALLKKAVPFREWKDKQDKQIERLGTKGRRIFAIEFDKEGALVPPDSAPRGPAAAAQPSATVIPFPSRPAPASSRPTRRYEFAKAGHRPPDDDPPPGSAGAERRPDSIPPAQQLDDMHRADLGSPGERGIDLLGSVVTVADTRAAGMPHSPTVYVLNNQLPQVDSKDAAQVGQAVIAFGNPDTASELWFVECPTASAWHELTEITRSVADFVAAVHVPNRATAVVARLGFDAAGNEKTVADRDRAGSDLARRLQATSGDATVHLVGLGDGGDVVRVAARQSARAVDSVYGNASGEIVWNDAVVRRGRASAADDTEQFTTLDGLLRRDDELRLRLRDIGPRLEDTLTTLDELLAAHDVTSDDIDTALPRLRAEHAALVASHPGFLESYPDPIAPDLDADAMRFIELDPIVQADDECTSLASELTSLRAEAEDIRDRIARATDLPDSSAVPLLGDLLDVEIADADELALTAALRGLEGKYGPYYVRRTRAMYAIGRLREGEPEAVQWITMDADIVAPDQRVVGFISRRFYRDADHKIVAYNEKLELKEGFRGKGFATAYTAAMESYFRRSGVDRIGVHTKKDGGLVWARAGFGWDPEEEKLEDTVENIADAITILRTKVSDNDAALLSRYLARFEGPLRPVEEYPTPLELASLTGDDPDLGATLMRRSSWYGMKKLGDRSDGPEGAIGSRPPDDGPERQGGGRERVLRVIPAREEFAAAILAPATSDSAGQIEQGGNPEFDWLTAELGALATYFSRTGATELQRVPDALVGDLLPLWHRLGELAAEFTERGFGIWYERTMRHLAEWIVEDAAVLRYRNSYGAQDNVDATGNPVGMMNAVDLTGTMRYIVQTAEGTPRGGVMFVDAWNAVGDIVHGIEDSWVRANRGLTDNLESFNAGIRQRLSPDDAARATFTGKMASRRGFTEVVFSGPQDESGDRGAVLVTFVRPSRLWETRCRTLGREVGIRFPEVLGRAEWSSEIARLRDEAAEIDSRSAKVEQLAEWVAEWWAEQDGRDHAAVAAVAADVVRRHPGARQITPNTVLLPGPTVVAIAEPGRHDDVLTDMLLHNLELRSELRATGYDVLRLKPIADQDDSGNVTVRSEDSGSYHVGIDAGPARSEWVPAAQIPRTAVSLIRALSKEGLARVLAEPARARATIAEIGRRFADSTLSSKVDGDERRLTEWFPPDQLAYLRYSLERSIASGCLQYKLTEMALQQMMSRPEQVTAALRATYAQVEPGYKASWLDDDYVMHGQDGYPRAGGRHSFMQAAVEHLTAVWDQMDGPVWRDLAAIKSERSRDRARTLDAIPAHRRAEFGLPAYSVDESAVPGDPTVLSAATNMGSVQTVLRGYLESLAEHADVIEGWSWASIQHGVLEFASRLSVMAGVTFATLGDFTEPRDPPRFAIEFDTANRTVTSVVITGTSRQSRARDRGGVCPGFVPFDSAGEAQAPTEQLRRSLGEFDLVPRRYSSGANTAIMIGGFLLPLLGRDFPQLRLTEPTLSMRTGLESRLALDTPEVIGAEDQLGEKISADPTRAATPSADSDRPSGPVGSRPPEYDSELPVDHGFTEEQERLADSALRANGFADAGELRLPEAPDMLSRTGELTVERARWWQELADGSSPERRLRPVPELSVRSSPERRLSMVQKALIRRYPHQVGNAEGLPVWVRDLANRLSITRDLEAFIARRPHGRGFRWLRTVLSEAERQQFGNLIRTRNHLAHMENEARKLPDNPPVQVLSYEAAAYGGKGRVAVVLGDGDTATSVSWHVPGTTTTLRSLAVQFEGARNHYEETRRADPNLSAAAVVWIGYDAPTGPMKIGFVKAASPNRARIGHEIFVRDLLAFNATRSFNDTTNLPRNHLRPHSYGCVVVCLALATGLLADEVASVVLLGSPGMPRDTVAKSGIPAENFYAASSWRDPVTLWGGDQADSMSRYVDWLARILGLGHGIDPAGVLQRIAAEPTEAFDSGVKVHLGYLAKTAEDRPTECLAQCARIAADQIHTIVLVENRRPTPEPSLVGRRVGARPYDPESNRYDDGISDTRAPGARSVGRGEPDREWLDRIVRMGPGELSRQWNALRNNSFRATRVPGVAQPHAITVARHPIRGPARLYRPAVGRQRPEPDGAGDSTTPDVPRIPAPINCAPLVVGYLVEENGSAAVERRLATLGLSPEAALGGTVTGRLEAVLGTDQWQPFDTRQDLAGRLLALGPGAGAYVVTGDARTGLGHAQLWFHDRAEPGVVKWRDPLVRYGARHRLETGGPPGGRDRFAIVYNSQGQVDTAIAPGPRPEAADAHETAKQARFLVSGHDNGGATLDRSPHLLKLARTHADEIIRRNTMYGRRPQSVASAVYDKVSGGVFFGKNNTYHIGNPPIGKIRVGPPKPLHPLLAERMPAESLEEWPAGNCAETHAMNEALWFASLSGRTPALSDFVYCTVRTANKEVYPSCRNCQVLLDGATEILRPKSQDGIFLGTAASDPLRVAPVPPGPLPFELVAGRREDGPSLARHERPSSRAVAPDRARLAELLGRAETLDADELSMVVRHALFAHRDVVLDRLREFDGRERRCLELRLEMGVSVGKAALLMSVPSHVLEGLEKRALIRLSLMVAGDLERPARLRKLLARVDSLNADEASTLARDALLLHRKAVLNCLREFDGRERRCLELRLEMGVSVPRAASMIGISSDSLMALEQVVIRRLTGLLAIELEQYFGNAIPDPADPAFETIGDWIIAVRERRGLSRRDLADRMNCSTSLIGDVERNFRVTPNFLRRFGVALAVPGQVLRAAVNIFKPELAHYFGDEIPDPADPVYKSIAQWLRAVRQYRGLTVRELAHRMSRHFNGVVAAENGGVVTDSYLQAFGDALDIPDSTMRSAVETLRTPPSGPLPDPADPVYRTIGEWLVAVRQYRGLTQRKLAEIIGRHPSTLGSAELGRTNSLGLLRRWRHGLGVPAETLRVAICRFRGIENTPVRAEDEEFWELIATEPGSPEEKVKRDEIAQNYLYIAHAAARRWRTPYEETADLEQRFRDEILRAIVNHVPMGFPFSTHAWARCKGALLRLYFDAKFPNLDKRTRERVVRVYSYRNRKVQETGTEPDDTEISHALGMTSAEVAAANKVIDAKAGTSVHLEYDLPDSGPAVADEVVGKLSIWEAIADLPESSTAAALVHQCHLEGLTVPEAAARLGIESGHARQLLTRATEKIRVAFAGVDEHRPAAPPSPDQWARAVLEVHRGRTGRSDIRAPRHVGAASLPVMYYAALLHGQEDPRALRPDERPQRFSADREHSKHPQHQVTDALMGLLAQLDPAERDGVSVVVLGETPGLVYRLEYGCDERGDDGFVALQDPGRNRFDEWDESAVVPGVTSVWAMAFDRFGNGLRLSGPGAIDEQRDDGVQRPIGPIGARPPDRSDSPPRLDSPEPVWHSGFRWRVMVGPDAYSADPDALAGAVAAGLPESAAAATSRDILEAIQRVADSIRTRVGDDAVFTVDTSRAPDNRRRLLVRLDFTGTDPDAETTAEDVRRTLSEMDCRIDVDTAAPSSDGQVRYSLRLDFTRQRILVFCNRWGLGGTGMAALNMVLCRSLAEVGHEVIVRTAEVGPSPPIPGLTVIGPRVTDRFARMREQMLSDWAELPDSVDVAIVHNATDGLATALAAEKKYPGAKLARILHLTPMLWNTLGDTPARGRAMVAADVFLARRMDLVAGLGPVLAMEALSSAAMAGRGLIHELQPGLEVAEQPPVPPPGEPARILVFGRVDDPLKGVVELARAVRQLRDRGRDVQLIVRGYPRRGLDAARAELAELIGDPNSVMVAPRTANRETLRADIRSATVVVMPSRAEAFGLVALEAIEQGVPVLVPSSSGAGRFLSDLAGYRDEATRFNLVEQPLGAKPSVGTWAAGLDSVLHDVPGAWAAARRLQELAEPYTRERSARMFMHALRNAEPAPARVIRPSRVVVTLEGGEVVARGAETDYERILAVADAMESDASVRRAVMDGAGVELAPSRDPLPLSARLAAVHDDEWLFERSAVDQRGTILRAFVATVSARGFRATTVADICHRAGMPRTAFDEHFASIEDAFVAARSEALASLRRLVVNEVRTVSESGGAARIDVAVRALLGALAARPATSRLLLIEGFALDSTQRAAHHTDVAEAIGAMLPNMLGMPMTVARRAIVAAIHGMLIDSAVSEGVEGLPALHRPLAALLRDGVATAVEVAATAGRRYAAMALEAPPDRARAPRSERVDGIEAAIERLRAACAVALQVSENDHDDGRPRLEIAIHAYLNALALYPDEARALHLHLPALGSRPLHDRHRSMLVAHLTRALGPIDAETGSLLASAVTGAVTYRLTAGPPVGIRSAPSPRQEPARIASLPTFTPTVTALARELIAGTSEPDRPSGPIGSRPPDDPSDQTPATGFQRALDRVRATTDPGAAAAEMARIRDRRALSPRAPRAADGFFREIADWALLEQRLAAEPPGTAYAVVHWPSDIEASPMDPSRSAGTAVLSRGQGPKELVFYNTADDVDSAYTYGRRPADTAIPPRGNRLAVVKYDPSGEIVPLSGPAVFPPLSAADSGGTAADAVPPSPRKSTPWSQHTRPDRRVEAARVDRGSSSTPTPQLYTPERNILIPRVPDGLRAEDLLKFALASSRAKNGVPDTEAALTVLRSNPEFLREYLGKILLDNDILVRISNRSYIHDNGFFKIVIEGLEGLGSLRLHGYHEKQHVAENPHSHMWRFASEALVGDLEEIRYRQFPGSPAGLREGPYVRRIFRGGPGAGDPDEAGVRLVPFETVVHKPGKLFMRWPTDIHSVRPRTPKVLTLFLKSPDLVTATQVFTPENKNTALSRIESVPLGPKDVEDLIEELRALIAPRNP
ncbi:alpha/beta hydrolase [Nocardia thraciensis]